METDKEVQRFNWHFALLLAVAALADIALVWAFARFLMFLRSL